MTQPDLVSKLREALVRTNAALHKALCGISQRDVDEIIAHNEVLLDRATPSPSTPIVTSKERFVSRDEFNDEIADEAAQSCVDWSDLERRKEAMRYIVKQIWNEAITERESSTPIVPGTPDDPRFNGVVVEVAEEFAILDGGDETR